MVTGTSDQVESIYMMEYRGQSCFLQNIFMILKKRMQSAEEIYHLAVLRLKAYTDEIHKKQIYDKNLLTGIVNGESSVVYTYLYLSKTYRKKSVDDLCGKAFQHY